MKNKFIQTKNSLKIMQAIEALNSRGAEEACLMVVDGLPGLGKSATIEYLATQYDSAFVRAKAEWTATWFLSDLLKSIGLVPEYSFSKKFEQVIGAIAARMEVALNMGSEFYIFIDEVDHITGNKKILETIRDISDSLQVPVVLVGMGKVRSDLTKRYPQIASRISQFVEFKPADIDDTKAMINGLCDYVVDNDLIAYVHKHTKGMYRETKEAIAHIENHGKNQGGETINLASMDGKHLMNNRANGEPIYVKVV